MSSLENVSQFSMSGRRAVFTLKPGAKLDREAISDAYADNGLKFESLSEEKRAKAKTYYVANAGVT